MISQYIVYLCFLQFELMLSEDGSGKGAALVAAVAWRTGGSTQAQAVQVDV